MAFLAPPGVPGCLRDLEKNCKNSQKIYKKLTCIKIPQIIALRPILGYLDYPGGPQGGQKVIWWCKKFFLAESIWSFRQNTLYLSQVSGLGGHEPWFWLCPFTIPPYHSKNRIFDLVIRQWYDQTYSIDLSTDGDGKRGKWEEYQDGKSDHQKFALWIFSVTQL